MVKRRNFLTSMVQSWFGTDGGRSQHSRGELRKVVSETCVEGLETIVEGRRDEDFTETAIAPLEQEVLTELIASGLVERRTVTPAKIRSGRDWVVGAVQVRSSWTA